MLKNIVRTICVGFVLVSVSTLANVQMTVEQEINYFSQVFSVGTDQQKMDAIKEIEWKGLGSRKIFDEIEKDILSRYKGLDYKDKDETNMLAWLAKGLSYSGNLEYREALDEVVRYGETAVGKRNFDKYWGWTEHLKKAKNNLINFQRWNSIISKGVDQLPAATLVEQRFTNMLKSSDAVLIRVAAREIYHNYADNKVLTDEAETILLSHYGGLKGNDMMVDSLSWLCKALANSGNVEYREALEVVASDASSRKLRKYAKKSLRHLR